MQRTTAKRRKRANRLWRRVFYPVEYAIIRVAVAFIQALPMETAYAVGRVLGRLAFRLDVRHRDVALAQLAAVYGDGVSEEERVGITRRLYENIGQNVVDLAFMPRVLRAETLRGLVVMPESVAQSLASLAGRGALFVSGHLGNWEVLGAAMALYGFPLHSVARPLDNPYLDAFVLSTRQVFGQRIVGKHGAIASMTRVIKSGGCLAVLVDQDARHHGIFVDFLGIPAATTSSVATLAHRYGVPIITGYVRRRGNGFRHEIAGFNPIFPDPKLPLHEDVRRLTQAYTHAIGEYVRETPEQWLWIHRRWKTRPEGESAPPLFARAAGAAT